MATDAELEAAGYRTKSAQARRLWRCRVDDPKCTKAKPCRSCRGRANRAKGKRGERIVRNDLKRQLGLVAVRTQGAASIGEEAWRGLPFRVEVKSGKQVSRGLVTMFEKCEKQSDDQRAVGDNRDVFVLDAEPEGWSDGLLVIRRSQLSALLEALTE